MQLKQKVRSLFSSSRQALQNERGLTLIEMLIAILVFILASVFIVAMVTSALDKPKEAGVNSVLSSYESAAQLLLVESSGDINGDSMAAWVSELNLGVDPTATFADDGSGKFATTLENPYGNKYYVEITEDPSADKASVVVSTQGAKDSDIYSLGVYYLGGEVHIATNGFGRNDKMVDPAVETDLATAFSLVDGDSNKNIDIPSVTP